MTMRGANDDRPGAYEYGIHTVVLDKGYSRRQRRSAQPPNAGALMGWPASWRELLTLWLRSDSDRRSWNSLLRLAGNARYSLACDLVDALLEAGWIRLSERRIRDRWDRQHLEWLAADDLREAFGLPRYDTRAAHRRDTLAETPEDERLATLHASLHALGTPSLIRRAPIVAALARWTAERRNGTRQQFALYACGDTKALTSNDWRWLSANIDLEEFGVTRHAPALWLRGPCRLHNGDKVLDLKLVPDLVGLSPLTLSGIDTISGDIDAWLLIENRTSFEQVARQVGGHQAVVWMPGFVPDWWLQAMDNLLRLLPRPAWIAADPDPAGIEIAQRAGTVWREHGLPWLPWGMDLHALRALRQHKSLNDDDRRRLDRLSLQGLTPSLGGLVDAIAELGIKGEQEGLDLVSLLPSHLTRQI